VTAEPKRYYVDCGTDTRRMNPGQLSKIYEVIPEDHPQAEGQRKGHRLWGDGTSEERGLSPFRPFL